MVNWRIVLFHYILRKINLFFPYWEKLKFKVVKNVSINYQKLSLFWLCHLRIMSVRRNWCQSCTIVSSNKPHASWAEKNLKRNISQLFSGREFICLFVCLLNKIMQCFPQSVRIISIISIIFVNICSILLLDVIQYHRGCDRNKECTMKIETIRNGHQKEALPTNKQHNLSNK